MDSIGIHMVAAALVVSRHQLSACSGHEWYEHLGM
jgi:hypothetical protein